MKPERRIVAERPLARHCAELLRPAPASAELDPLLATAAERLARALRGALAPLLGGEPPMVECHVGPDIAIEDFAANPGLHAWSVYGTGPGQPQLISAIDAEAVLRLVDRAFGGPGEAPRPMPRELPLSGELMVQRMEAVLTARLGEALAGKPAIRALRRDSTLAQIQPYSPGTRLAVLTIEITEGTRAPWTVRFGLPVAALPALTGLSQLPRPRKPAPPADPLAQPFADMPLPVRALLVDVALPLSTVSRLEVGQVLNLPIARSVPLRVGATTIAHGAIGAVDDRVALQLTQIS